MSSTLVSFHLATRKYLGYNGIDQSMSTMTHHESVITVFLLFRVVKNERGGKRYKPKAVKLLINCEDYALIFSSTTLRLFVNYLIA